MGGRPSILKTARLWTRSDESVECLVCERRCRLTSGKLGACKNYANVGGELVHVGYGVLSAIESRPIEIKPFFHYWPNSTSLTFSGFGCNFYCPWCQNHHLSFSSPPKGLRMVPPEELVRMAIRSGDEGLCASFNEPATQFDYLVDLFTIGRAHGLYGTVVTNGYFTERALEMLLEAGVDGFSIDIKGCPASRRAIATIDHLKVFRNAKMILDMGGHVEMVYLVVTGFNDTEECVEWILGKHIDMLGPDVPLHVNRYHPANVWKEPPTPLSTLLKIRERAKEVGINYVYVGNVGLRGLEDTCCPRCSKLLISRRGYRVTYFVLDGDRCPRCSITIPVRGKYVSKS